VRLYLFIDNHTNFDGPGVAFAPRTGKKNADLKVGVVCGASLWTLDVLFELGVSSVLSQCDAGQALHRRVTVF
jgi:hypothetical protein